MKIINKLEKHSKIYYSLLITILTGLSLILIFNNNVWADEVYTILFIKGSWSEMQNILNADVHPPLYYYISKIFTNIFGLNVPVLKIVSIIPMTLTMVLGATVVDKYFGNKKLFLPTSFILICFCVPQALLMVLELRMYSWSMFFVTASAIFAGIIYLNGFTFKHTTLFVLFSLAGAYTHYFALLAIAVIYLFLFIFMIIKKKENFKICALISAITIVSYLPWLMVFIKQLNMVTDNYWIEAITARSAFEISFCWITKITSWKLTLALIAVFLCACVFLFIKNNIKDIKTASFKENLIIGIAFSSIFFFTILAGIVLSSLIRPIFIDRYIYPCIPLVWFGIAFILEKIVKSKTMKVIFLIILLAFGVKFYMVEIENANPQLVDNTINFIDENYQDGDVLMSNEMYFNGFHLSGCLFEYYFSDKTFNKSDKENIDDLKNLENASIFYLTRRDNVPLDENELSEYNLTSELVYSGKMSTYDIDIYKYSRNK